MMINTKYGKKTLAVILLWLFSMTILIGCASSNLIAPTNSQEVTPTSTASAPPIPTPTPEPTPSATPSPKQELTYEQKKLIVGSTSKVTDICLGMIYVYTIEIYGHNYRIFTYNTVTSDPSKEGVKRVHSVFNNEYLFTIILPQGNYSGNSCPPNTSYYKYATEFSSMLTNAKLIDSIGLLSLPQIYRAKGKDYLESKVLKELGDKFSYGSIEEAESTMRIIFSTDQFTDLYIDSTPQAELLPFWLYTPNTKMPDELAGIYDEAYLIPSTSPS